MTATVLIIDDDPDTAKLIRLILESRGIIVHHAPTGQEGLKLVYELQPDLIILDIMLPGMDGFEVCSRIREFSSVPILILTAKSRSTDLQRGFAAGADNYVRKPFSNEELIARIDYLLKRNQNSFSNPQTGHLREYDDGFVRLNLDTQKVYVQQNELSLTSTETKLLTILAIHPCQTLSARSLLADVWGDAYSHDKSLLPYYVHQLREKLKDAGATHDYIQTQWGQGYRFNPLQKSTEPIDGTAISTPQEPPRKIRGFPDSKLAWLFPAGLIILMVFIAFQTGMTPAFGYDHNANHTTISARISAEGFKDPTFSGLHGKVCVQNTGKYATKNLTIVNTIQFHTRSKVQYVSNTVDLGKNPVIQPGEIQCYPFEITFEPSFGGNIFYQAKTLITITNHTALLTGTKACSSGALCPFGPEITTDFTVPSQ
jgi:two-component system KDP operon response regulator KdpE